MQTQIYRSSHRQRGAAVLLEAVVLFFILALVSAYASRNLIFEQRISANNQRATQAFEVAEAVYFSVLSKLKRINAVNRLCIKLRSFSRLHQHLKIFLSL